MNSHYKGTPDMPAPTRKALESEPEQIQGEMERVWRLAELGLTSPVASSPDEMDRSLEAVRQRMAAHGGEIRPSSAQQHRAVIFPMRRIWSYAAAASLALLLGAYAYWALPVSVEAGYGETVLAELPDGSTVELNSGSSISYARGFDGNPFTEPSARRVTLVGEGYFDVAHTGTSFVVETFNAEIQVLGTEFNVRARTDGSEASTTVALASGRVQVNRLAGDERILLEEPGQFVAVFTERALPATPEQIDLNQTLIWRKKGFASKNEPLAMALAELERRFDVTIFVEDASILQDSLNILLPRPGGIETILDDICNTRGLKYRQTSRGYFLYRPNTATQ